jgi:hypothetical protein
MTGGRVAPVDLLSNMLGDPAARRLTATMTATAPVSPCQGHTPASRRRVVLVDGTLAPCWSYAEHPELWNGKHKTTASVTIGTPADVRMPVRRIECIRPRLPERAHQSANYWSRSVGLKGSDTVRWPSRCRSANLFGGLTRSRR